MEYRLPASAIIVSIQPRCHLVEVLREAASQIGAPKQPLSATDPDMHVRAAFARSVDDRLDDQLHGHPVRTVMCWSISGLSPASDNFGVVFAGTQAELPHQ